jgi:porin
MKQLVSILTIVLLFVLAFEVAGFSSSAQAQTGTHTHEVGTSPDRSFKDIWNRDKLTGDWGGLRTDLADHGIDIGIRMSHFGQWVADGGVDTTGRYGGKVDYRLNIDASKLFGLWKGFYLSMHAETRFGHDVNAQAGAFALPNTPMLYPKPGGYNDTDVTGLTVTQMLFDGRAALLFGKVHVVDLVTTLFPQVAYGQEGFWNVNSLVSALPWFRFVNLSVWGGGGWTITDKGQMQSGLIVFGHENVTTSWDIGDSFKDGPSFFGFYRFFYDVADKPGYLLFGAGGSTKKYRSLDETDWFEIPGEGLEVDRTHHTFDVAAYLHQVFWQAAGDVKRHADFFMGGTIGDDNPNFSRWNLFASIETFGLMASRPADRMGISMWYSGLTNDFKNLASNFDIRLRDTWGVELYYNYEINKWLHLSPDFQLVKNQNTRDDLAVIPGIRLVMDF